MTATRNPLWRLLALAGVLAMFLAGCSDSGSSDDPDDAATDQAAAEDTGSDAAATTLTIVADTVGGPLNIPQEQAGTSVCVLQSRFPRNSEIVWRARVVDGNGEELDDTALESVEVQLADGQVFEMRYGPHPRDNPADFFWTAAFDVPTDYPTGTLGYEIVATGPDGASGTFTPFQVTPSLLTITDEVLETIEETET